MTRYKMVKVVSLLGIVGNLFLCIIKSLVGLITGSQAMIADSFNSAGDILTSLITYVGNKIASKPSDDDHNLGHGKAEYIYSMLISIVMILASVTIFKDSLISLLENKEYNFSIWLIIVCIITIIIKVSLYVLTSYIARKEHNLLISANSMDHFYDSVITFLNLIACLLSLKNIYWFDGIVGIIIVFWIMYSSLKIFKESYDVLMDKSISEETKLKVYEIIKSHKEIRRIVHFNSTPVGYKYQISFTIFVDGNLTTFESHEIADKLEKEINEKIDEIYLTVIHVNPIIVK